MNPKTTKMLVLLALGGGVLYVLLRRNPVTGQTMLEQLVTPTAAYGMQDQFGYRGPGNTSGYGPAQPPSKSTAVIGAIGAGSAAVGALAGIGGSTAAAATAGGIGTAATIGLTAGIAGGVLLTWAVWKKGLFRGGEEALLVNPDRDQFLLQFGPPSNQHGVSWEDGGNGKLAALLTQLTGEPNGSHYWTALAKADTVKEFETATRDIQRLLASHGINIQAP